MKKIFSDNKKANAVFDTLTLIIVVFIFLLVAIVGGIVLNKVSPMIKSQITPGSPADKILDNGVDKYPKVFDGLVLFVFIALWIGGIIASFMVDTHPIFATLTFILIFFVIIASVIISNYYQSMLLTNSDMGTEALQFVRSNWIMTHLMELTILIGFSIAISLYAKSR